MADAFDPSVPVPMDLRTPFFDVTAENWPDRHAAGGYVRLMHSLDMRRAAQPPAVHVTVAGVPGHFITAPGGRTVAYQVTPPAS